MLLVYLLFYYYYNFYLAYGFDGVTQMDDIRHLLGICPQHDVLYDELTVKEHLGNILRLNFQYLENEFLLY